MPAYVVADIKITDPELYAQYRELAPPIVSSFGGEYVVRGGEKDILEGTCSTNLVVIVKFESRARARQWLDSDEYREVRKIRHKSTISRMFVVEALDE
jgi:uncharacterized protein (DUF1330 family)